MVLMQTNLTNLEKIAIDPLGTLYVADTENHRIQKWYNGASEGETVAGGKGGGAGLHQLDTPYGIATRHRRLSICLRNFQ